MEFKLSFNMDNAAFDGNPEVEVARILRKLADNVELTQVDNYSLRDANGNKIGQANIQE